MKSSRPKKKPLKKKKKKAKNDFKRMKRKDNNSEPPGCLKTFKKALKRCQIQLGCLPPSKVNLFGDAAKVAEHLELNNRELSTIKMSYELIDIDNSGEIDYDELLEFIESQRSPFSDAVIALVDEQGSGTLDFNSFFRIVCLYCYFSEEDILNFCFQTFDKDSSGQIDEDEFLDLARTVNNAEPLFPGNFKTALQQFDQNDDGLLDFNEFKLINRAYPMVFYPAFKMQASLQQQVLGERWWQGLRERMHERKMVEEYMALHDGKRPPVPCIKKVAKTIFPCCFRQSSALSLDKTADGVALKKKRKAGQKVRRKQKGASSKKTRTKKVVPLMNDDEEEQETYNGAPPLTKREKMARLSSQRITKVASGEKQHAW
eukprot:INCI681.3.p1 GENE.INCI681.3~~INCI681.3.p1  ORF type:complete len:373 (-),score=82.67 INCI681.3:80-1198(-)